MTPAGGNEAVAKQDAAKEKIKEDGRHTVDKQWIFACVTVFLLTLGVHYKALCEDRTDLSLSVLINSMEAKCRALGDVFTQQTTKMPLHPVPASFGVAVWVEREAWSLPVHEALDRIEESIGRHTSMNDNNNTDSNSFASVYTSTSLGGRGPRLIQRIVRVSERRAKQNAQSGGGSLVSAATTQQLGLQTARHVYAADLQSEMLMHGISFFASSSSSSKSMDNNNSNAPVKCFSFDERQAYCTLPANATQKFLQREITAAVATLMSRWMRLDNFREAAAVRRWTTERAAQGCMYGLRALRQLERSVNAHPDMPVPLDVAETARRLQSLIDAGVYVHFARAADDLQFHPLLLPQLYIPWDQALVIHLSILLPVVSVGMIGIRTMVVALKQRRKKAKLQESAEDVEKKNE